MINLQRLLLANQLTQYINGLLCTRKLGFELIYIDRETLLNINDVHLYDWNFNGFDLSEINFSAIKCLSKLNIEKIILLLIILLNNIFD